jgi:dihydrofolate reductase
MIYTIFSVDQMGGFGNKGSLPWEHDPEDMGWFREHTLGHTVVMGRGTWDDPKMPKPMPDRENCVISSSPLHAKHFRVNRFHKNYKERLVEMSKATPNKKIFILGGPKLIMDCLDIIDWAYITHRKGAGFTDVKLDMTKFMATMMFRSCRPSKSGMLNFCTYKNNNLKENK